MPYTVVFLWISATATQPRALDSEALRDFGATRGLTLVAPAKALGPAGARSGLDEALGDRLETDLEQVRTALSALEESAAIERLDRVQAALQSHPYLPQATFLMAECFALRAQAARGSDPTLARELDAQRAALEGPRTPAFGEPETAALPARPELAFSIAGLGPTDLVELDGQPARAPQQLRAAPGLHHFRIWRAGDVVFATFAELEPGRPEVVLRPPPPVPCDSSDLSGARDGTVPAGIACGSWARVRPEGDGIGVSVCRQSSCGPYLHWQARPHEPFTPIAVERGLPAWAGITIAGAAAALVTGLVLWQSGALDRGQRSATTLEYNGYRPQAIRF